MLLTQVCVQPGGSMSCCHCHHHTLCLPAGITEQVSDTCLHCSLISAGAFVDSSCCTFALSPPRKVVPEVVMLAIHPLMPLCTLVFVQGDSCSVGYSATMYNCANMSKQVVTNVSFTCMLSLSAVSDFTETFSMTSTVCCPLLAPRTMNVTCTYSTTLFIGPGIVTESR